MLTANIHVNLKTISGSDQASAWLLSYCFFISKNEMCIYIYCNYTVIYTGWWFQPSEKYGDGADKRPCNGTISAFVASVSNLNVLRVFHIFASSSCVSMSSKPSGVHRCYSFLSILPQKKWRFLLQPLNSKLCLT